MVGLVFPFGLLPFSRLFETTVAFEHGLAIVGNDLLVHATLEDAVCDRCCTIERAECTDYYTEDHSECERTDGVTTKEEDTEQHEQCRERCHDRTAQSSVECLIESQ